VSPIESRLESNRRVTPGETVTSVPGEEPPAATLGVAVVIPCYESARFIRSAVLATLRQTLRPTQVVVVDDGSTDRPRDEIDDLLESESGLTIVHQPNSGVAAARQAGFSEVGDVRYVLFLDADDVPEPTMLERLAETLEKRPAASAAWCLPLFIDQAGSPIPEPLWRPRLEPRGLFGVREVPLTQPETSFASIFALAEMMPSLVLIRCASFDAVGGWDLSLGQGYEDTDLFLRLVLQGDFLLCPERLLRRRTHPGQSTSQVDHYWRQEQRLRSKWRNLERFDVCKTEVVLSGWRFYDRQLALRAGWNLAVRRACACQYWRAAQALLGAVRLYLRSCLIHRSRLRRT
jgi:glycosyltransferase involved in cell wall biosynthesis